jgi:two-component sensor histidine kinase
MSNYRVSPQWDHAAEITSASWDVATPGSLTAMEPEASKGERSNDVANLSPRVIFEAKPSLEIISVSESVTDLLGLKSDAVIGHPQFWQERVAAEDWPIFQENVSALKSRGAVSFIHRVADVFDLPVWLAHSLRKVERNGENWVHGCLVPIYGGSRIHALDQEIVARFIHKLGNHFQLLNLVVNSLKKSLPDSRENEILQETLDKAIDLTRIFSDCNQTPSLVSDVQLLDVMKAAAESRISQFAATGVRLIMNFEEIPDDATIASDRYLLETALGHILQNAFEAISGSGNVQVGGSLISNGPRGAARIYIRDTGCGIPAREVPKVTLPFFSTKKGHDGLGLTVASRCIELHGGTLKIKSAEGTGTEAEILLPMERGRDIHGV